MGTFAIPCLILGQFAEDTRPITLNMTESEIENIYQLRQYDASNIAILNSLILLLLFVFKIGALAKIFSPAMLSGFITGAACHVFTSQIKTILGLDIARSSSSFKLLETYKNLGIAGFEVANGSSNNRTSLSIDNQMNSTNLNTTSGQNMIPPTDPLKITGITTVLSIGLVILLIIIRNINEKYRKTKFKNIPIPGELLVLIIGTLIVHFLNLPVKIVGKVAQGLPEIGMASQQIEYLKDWDLLGQYFNVAVSILAVGYTSGLSIAVTFGKKFEYENEIDLDQELLAYSASNFLGGLFQCLPAYGSISRSCIQAESGGKSQITSVFSSILLLLVISFAGPLFYHTPLAALSSIVVVSVTSMLKKYQEFGMYHKISKIDGITWLVTFLTTILTNVVLGLMTGFFMCLLILIIRLFKNLQTMKTMPDFKQNSVLDFKQFNLISGSFNLERNLVIGRASCHSASVSQSNSISTQHQDGRFEENLKVGWQPGHEEFSSGYGSTSVIEISSDNTDPTLGRSSNGPTTHLLKPSLLSVNDSKPKSFIVGKNVIIDLPIIYLTKEQILQVIEKEADDRLYLNIVFLSNQIDYEGDLLIKNLPGYFKHVNLNIYSWFEIVSSLQDTS